MADIEFNQMRDAQDLVDVVVVDAVAGVDLESGGVGELRTTNKAGQLGGPLGAEMVGVSSGVELDELSPELGGGGDLSVRPDR